MMEQQFVKNKNYDLTYGMKPGHNFALKSDVWCHLCKCNENEKS